MALGCLFLSGLGLMLFNAVSNSMLQTAPPNELRGRVMGLRAFVFAGLAPFGALQIGAVAQWLGVRTALGLSAGGCAVAGIIRYGWYGIVARGVASRRGLTFSLVLSQGPGFQGFRQVRGLRQERLELLVAGECFRHFL